MEQQTIESKPFRVLLYYKFVQIDDPQTFAQEHLRLCRELGLKGRIIVAEEGINGTVSGTVEQTNAYMKAVHADPRFADMWFKIDEEEKNVFKKMFVRAKQEIVTFRLDRPVNPNRRTGKYLSPKEFYEHLQQEDVVVIDGRNGYEWDLGHFRRAIRPDIDSFREFPEWIRENISHLKDKKIITYCTGGIRCEKLTGFLLDEGFEDVSQLHGGIVTYGNDPEVQGRLFDGKCYVFDERIAVPVNRTEEDVVISTCAHCGNPSDRYINCSYDQCHTQHFCCEDCEPKSHGYCCPECQEVAESQVQA